MLVLGAWAILAFAAAEGSRASEQSDTAVVPDEVAVKPPVCGPATALRQDEYGLWEGEWVMKGSNMAGNYYSILRIRNVDSGGFSCETECRDVPYGPNAHWSGEEQAGFESSVAACTPEPETRFRLRVDPDDRHARTLEAGRDPLTVRTEAAPDAPYPSPLAHWLDERKAIDPAQ